MGEPITWALVAKIAVATAAATTTAVQIHQAVDAGEDKPPAPPEPEPLPDLKTPAQEIVEKVAPKTAESIKDLLPDSIKQARARVLRTSQRGVEGLATTAKPVLGSQPALGSMPTPLGGFASYLGR